MKILKKDDLRDCDNWRGVNLLPINSKTSCRMIIEQINIDIGVDKKLRKEQAGLRP